MLLPRAMRSLSFTAAMAPYKSPSYSNVPLFQRPFNFLYAPRGLQVLTRRRIAAVMCCSGSDTSTFSATDVGSLPPPPLVIKKRKRYRKLYPGEKKGITEEMRFVAMRLRNIKGKYTHKSTNSEDDGVSDKEEEKQEGDGETWVASMEGFVKYLVDSKLVFDTVECIVDKSDDVSYGYFRRTGLERSEGLAKDIQWFSQQDIKIPEPATPGISYSNYLEELARKNAPLFLCHFYNIYFSHLAGGQVIAKQVSEQLLKGKKLEFYRWEGNEQELLKDIRENLNMLGEHWSRDVKNKCLKEATKSFRYMGQIVRLIIS